MIARTYQHLAKNPEFLLEQTKKARRILPRSSNVRAVTNRRA